MTQEEKQILLVDLCARLPYGVILGVTLKDKYDEIVTRDIQLSASNLTYITSPSNWIEYKPYLRSMSSMTKEEREEILSIDYVQRYTGNCWSWMFASYKQIDWLNAHHFDYRGLIEKGLALEAPADMYK